MAFVDEIVEILKPLPPTEREMELAAQMGLDDYTIYYDKLFMICEEATELFVRAGVTTMLLSGDLVVGIYTPDGDLVQSVTGAYIHAVTASPAIKYIIRRFKDDPSVGVHEGDVFFFNDILYGSLHSPDEGVVMPVFFEGELIAFAGAAVQETEVGAIDPGMTPRAKTRFDEGLKMPPVKIGEGYVLRQDLIEAMANMSRTPGSHLIDTRARTIACDCVRLRLQELAADKGKDFVSGLFTRILLECEAGIKKKIQQWRDGTYRSVIFFDNIGYTEGLQKFTLELIKEGDRLTFDFTKTSQETDGAWNSFPHCAVAHICVWLYGAIYADLPPSSAVFLSHDFKFRPGSILHANANASFQDAGL
jgi:N-methylhydantoinase B/oxoprolinase/acetone carboxylase alpha subunit